jgi:type IV pilus biogenesis protein CpaD/CtpE
MTRIRIIVALAAGMLLISACASRPSEQDLTNAILTATEADPTIEVSDELAACIARVLLQSALSDTTLSGMAENFDNPEVLQTELNDVEPQVTSAALECS